MKTITVNKRSQVVKQLLDMARQEDLLLRSEDGDEFMLVAVDDFDWEIAQQRANKKLMRFLDDRFRKARKQKGTPLDEVARRLGVELENAKVPRRKTGTHPR